MLKDITLSQFEVQIILGGLLGDAYFNKQRKFIRFSQGIKQEEYLKLKYSYFNKENIRGLYYNVRKEGYKNVSFEFTNLKGKYDTLYSWINKHLYSNEGRKKISLKYLEELNEIGLAIWWMDDGCLSIHKGNRYGKLCTHCFNYEEHILLQKYFKKKWNINVDIKIEKNKYYFLKFNVEALKKLISIIYKFVCLCPSMIYKIDLNYSNSVQMNEFRIIYDYIKNKNNFQLKEL